MTARRAIQVGIFVALSMSLTQPASGAISLNQLSSCPQLQEFRAALDDRPACRPPQGEIARVLAERIESWPSIGLCFHAAPPSKVLSGFACAEVRMGETPNSLVCLREVPSADIRDYRVRNRQVYDPLVKEYLKQAGRCDAGNGDPAIMASTMLPWIVSVIAEFEFGYVLPIGDRLVGSSAFVHGYGRLDPELGADRYLEYLYTWKNLR